MMAMILGFVGGFAAGILIGLFGQYRDSRARFARRLSGVFKGKP